MVCQHSRFEKSGIRCIDRVRVAMFAIVYECMYEGMAFLFVGNLGQWHDIQWPRQDELGSKAKALVTDVQRFFRLLVIEQVVDVVPGEAKRKA